MSDTPPAILPLRFEGYGMDATEDERRHWYEKRTRQAQAAYELGHTCLNRGQTSAGLFWLGRAERLAGNNAHVTLSYAITALDLGLWPDALRRFRALEERFSLAEAAFGVVMCLYRMGRFDEAARTLGGVLSRYHATDEFYDLAGELSRHYGAPGWATLSNSGELLVRAAAPFRLGLDGQRLGQFPAGRHVLSGQDGISVPHWALGRRLSVRVNGKHVLGSPFDLPALTKCVSLVRPEREGISGWAWHPAEPQFVPRITLDGGAGVMVHEPDIPLLKDHPLCRARSFFLPFTQLPGDGCQSVMLRDTHDRPLLGVPLDSCLGRVVAGQPPFPKHLMPVPVQPTPSRPVQARPVEPECAIIIPVYRDEHATMQCLDSVLANVPKEMEVIVVDDATPEPLLARSLDRLATAGNITLLRHETNQGFPISVNCALRHAGRRDVILLNSDTVVFPGWVERLRRWLRPQNVGTATPLSNNGGLLSYPSEKEETPPTLTQSRRLDQLCQKEHVETTPVEMPTGNGFCMAISAACLAETGLLREDVFAQGYGEENDFCLRATALGFRHVAATDVYIYHRQGTSFQEGRDALMARNLELLNALHPGYDREVQVFRQRDPLQHVRRRLDQAVLEDCKVVDRKPRGAVVMVQHNAGGGVARAVRERALRFAEDGLLALRLRPTMRGCVVELCDEPQALPNMHFDLPSEGPLLVGFLRHMRVLLVEWHQLVGHAPWIRRLHHLLDVPYDVFIHDHIWFCPRIALLAPEGRYCGEPDVRGCEACVARGDPPEEALPVPDLLERSTRELVGARRVVAPSDDAARRLKRHIPSCNAIQIEPLEHDRALLAEIPGRRPACIRRRIGVLGGISLWKGYAVLQELGQYIQDQSLPLDVILVGGTEDDESLMAAGIYVTGEYQDTDVAELVRQQRIDLGFIPSIAPETWCYTLGWLWKEGLDVLCFDIGAVSERIRHSGRGAVLPLGLPIPVLADVLMRYRC